MILDELAAYSRERMEHDKQQDMLCVSCARGTAPIRTPFCFEQALRKDGLHQNYLKRKASGKHQAYENKIKDKRKADIDAKKAAIRAEDIAKGVFVPVCNLPRAEPKVAKPKGA